MDIQSMSLEEKVGQLFIVSFDGTKVNGQLMNVITTYKVGGIYYESNNFKNPRQVHTLSTHAQRYADKTLPLLIAARQQGGPCNTVANGVSLSPSQRKIGQINNRLYTKQMAEIVALELRAMGVHVNIAPNLQLKADDEQSFGDNVQHTARHGLAAVQGHHQANIIAAPLLDDLLQLFREDLFHSTTLKPYIQNLQNELDMAVFTHDTLEKFHQNSNLRIIEAKQIEHKALDCLIIADCSGVTEPADIQSSIESGADLIILNGTIEHQLNIIDRIIEMVKQGALSEEKLNVIVERILTFKKTKNIGKLVPFQKSNFARKRAVAFSERLTNF